MNALNTWGRKKRKNMTIQDWLVLQGFRKISKNSFIKGNIFIKYTRNKKVEGKWKAVWTVYSDYHADEELISVRTVKELKKYILENKI